MSADHLNDFDGLPVRKASIAVTNAGDGLSDALGVDPREYHIGDRVFVVLETTVDKIRHVPIPEKDGEGLNRQHTLKAGRATIVERELVVQLLNAQQAKIDAAKGVVPLPGMGNGEKPADEPEGI